MKEEILVLKSFRISRSDLQYVHTKRKSGAWLRAAISRAIEVELQMQEAA